VKNEWWSQVNGPVTMLDSNEFLIYSWLRLQIYSSILTKMNQDARRETTMKSKKETMKTDAQE
jgi:hypothetical protein